MLGCCHPGDETYLYIPGETWNRGPHTLLYGDGGLSEYMEHSSFHRGPHRIYSTYGLFWFHSDLTLYKTSCTGPGIPGFNTDGIVVWSGIPIDFQPVHELELTFLYT